MFERYRDTSVRHHPAPSSKSDDLPFDLELTRRVNGEMMVPKWGTRDPADPPVVDSFDDLPNGADMAEPFEPVLGGELMLPQRGIDIVPSLWSRLPMVRFGHGETPIEAQIRLTRHDRAMLRAFDDLRTQLLRTMHGAGWSRIAIAAPTAGCGASFTALNLALAIARIPDARALLMDMDQRTPSIAAMLGIKARGGMHRLLSGDVTLHDHLVKPAETLTLGLGQGHAPNPSEVLHARRTGEVLDEVLETLRPDITLYDLPPMLEHDDLEAFLPQVDGVLLVADATRTLARQITECERRLEGKSHLLGVILNRTRPSRESARRAA
ncbi:CpsD/CapB family tyrosine-protein kinase [Roseovarius sp. S4756]|uniref:CpsD/CapB family tyrosine-protein kinase n=1 Tax=Roseovarius maritimus TaxID=3342637 RepID=UPI00372BFD61